MVPNSMKKVTHYLLGVLACVAVATGAASNLSGPETAKASGTLWYNQPAKSWMMEALPIGNGRLGGMIFGAVARERIQFNEISLWTGDDKDTGSYQAFGDLYIDFEHKDVTEYQRMLDLQRAVHKVQYSVGGVRYCREAFCSTPDQVLVVRLTADKPGSCSIAIKITGMHKEKVVCQDNAISFSGVLANGLAYEAQLNVLKEGGALTMSSDAIAISKADSVTLLLAAGTSYLPSYAKEWRGPHPHEKIAAQLAAAKNKPYAKLLQDHIADYKGLYDRVSFNIGATANEIACLPTERRLILYGKGGLDPDLEELFFQFGRYLLISSSRPGSLPANLQGLWNDSNNPPWRSDYHSNINIEMNYWPAEIANLAECHQPFLDYIKNQRAVRTVATNIQYKSRRGWTVQTENNIFGGSSWNWNPPGSAWYCQHLWEHYAFGGDKYYLRFFAYPILREICEFWEDRLQTLPDGSLVTPDGWSPEQGPHEPGVTYDQEIIWDLFTNYIEAADELGFDTDFRDKVFAMREKLVKPKIGKWGQLQEWMVDRDDPANTHRHVSHLFALHPGRQISPVATPELAAAAKKSLVARGDLSTGWAMAWRINFWARLLDGDHAYLLLRNLMKVVGGTGTDYNKGGGVYANMFDAHPPFQIDGNFGATAGIAEMLVQSHNRVNGAWEVQLLPALPKAWATGSVKGLRARGGITLNLAWTDQKITSIELTKSFEGPAQVRWGDKTTDLSFKAGQTIKLSGQMEVVP
jgi:alpha-L-fucosidase 2